MGLAARGGVQDIHKNGLADDLRYFAARTTTNGNAARNISRHARVSYTPTS
jgi:hypothetical protein